MRIFDRDTRFFLSLLVMICFVTTGLSIPLAQAFQTQELHLPAPGVMVHLSPTFNMAYLRGMTIHKDNPFRVDFFVNKGDQDLSDQQKKHQYKDLIKYFLAALATPDEDQWVNLSPYEKNRIIADDFAKTTMGRDLLAEDYMLKQITASLVYPEDMIGKKFWSAVYKQAQKKLGNTNVPVNTFNKVWIVPDKAVVYTDAATGSLYIVQSNLKVMLEEDYLSLTKHGDQPNHLFTVPHAHALASQILRQIVLPQIEKEVNADKNFAPLRQMYSAMILATWYKRAPKQSLLAKIYIDKSKVKGIDQNPASNQVIYQQYLKAFKKGVYNYIKEEIDPLTQQSIPRKYFSGGFTRNNVSQAMIVLNHPSQLTPQQVDQFANEAMRGVIDQVAANFNVFHQRLDRAMFSIKLTKGAFIPALLTLTTLLQLGCQTSKNISARSRDFLQQESKLYRIPMTQDPEVGLNNMFRTYYQNNGNSFFSPYDHFPLLAKLFSQDHLTMNSPDPFGDMANDIKQEESRLEASPTQRDQFNEEVALYIQQIFVRPTFVTKNLGQKIEIKKEAPNYVAHQPSMLEFFYNGTYNCFSISAAEVYVLTVKMNIKNIYREVVKEDEDGKRYPELMPDGKGMIGHADNVLKTEDGEHHYDQGAETHPHKVGSPESLDDIVGDLEGTELMNSERSFQDQLDKENKAAAALFDEGKKSGVFAPAQEAYAKIDGEIKAELQKLESSGFPDTYHPDNGDTSTMKEAKDRLRKEEQVASYNMQAAQSNDEGGIGAPVTPPDQVQDVDAFNSLVNQVNDLRSKGKELYQQHHFKEAAQEFQHIVNLINQSPDREDPQLIYARYLNHLNYLEATVSFFDFSPDKPMAREGIQKAIQEANDTMQESAMNQGFRLQYQAFINGAQEHLKNLAMTAVQHHVGGIDFNSRYLNLDEQGDKGQIAMTINPHAWDHVKILGLIPSIIEIKPISHWGPV